MQPLSPSDLGGAKALPGDLGEDLETALTLGSAVHLLLEHLPSVPQAHWADFAVSLVPDLLLRHAALADALPVLNAPEFAALFTADALAEVPLCGAFQDRVLMGVIDRLIITPTHIRAVDFKTNRVVPQTPGQVPEGILRQMGAYAHLLAQIYPNHGIQTEILWTATARLMPLPLDIVREALGRTTIP